MAQAALQVAAYRVLGHTFVGTYESTSARQFLHGRTETTRALSPSMVAMVKALHDKECSAEEKRQRIEEATIAHTAYSRNASQGKGVDRHFFGLSMLVQEGESMPDLVEDPVFLRSKRWLLSTSHVPSMSPGFGPVDPEGLGIGYDVRAHDMTFTVSGWKSTGRVEAMKDGIAQALCDLAEIVRQAPRSAPHRSRL